MRLADRHEFNPADVRSLLCSAAKLDLWPVDFDLATATLSSLPGGAAEFLRGIKVPVVRIVPVPEPGTPNPAVPSLNNARKFAALFSILFPKQYVGPALCLRGRKPANKSAISFGNQCAVIKANFKGVANSNRGIVMFTGLKPEEQPLFAAVYIDHDLPSLPNVRAAQQQRAGAAAGSQPAPQTQVPQPAQAPQQQMSQQQQAALLQMLNRQQQQGGPMNLNFPQNLNMNPAMVQAQQAQAQQQRYLAQQRLAAQVIHQQQQQQLANNSSGTGNVLNALGFIPGGPGPGTGAGAGGAFGQSAEPTALPPTFSANADMNAQLMALRQQHLQRLGSQAQSQQQPQQQMTNFLNLGGGGGFDMFNGLMGNK